jgi:hypothetical protein
MFFGTLASIYVHVIVLIAFNFHKLVNVAFLEFFILEH